MRKFEGLLRIGAAALLVASVGACGISTSETVPAISPSATATKARKPKPSPSQVAVVPDRWSAPTTGKTIYLTFDDGPSLQSPEILDVLKENHIQATFFVIGAMIPTRKPILQRMFQDGHAVGNHTWRHEDLTKLSTAKIKDNLTETARTIGRRMGPCMRPPYGGVNARVRKASKAVGMTPIMWNIDTTDWNHAPVALITARLLGAHGGSVVLMHDGGGDGAATATALRAALPVLKAKGYKFAAVPLCLPLSSNGTSQPPRS